MTHGITDPREIQKNWSLIIPGVRKNSYAACCIGVKRSLGIAEPRMMRIHAMFHGCHPWTDQMAAAATTPSENHTAVLAVRPPQNIITHTYNSGAVARMIHGVLYCRAASKTSPCCNRAVVFTTAQLLRGLTVGGTAAREEPKAMSESAAPAC